MLNVPFVFFKEKNFCFKKELNVMCNVIEEEKKHVDTKNNNQQQQNVIIIV